MDIFLCRRSDPAVLPVFFPYLRLLRSALEKIPADPTPVLYRGVKGVHMAYRPGMQVASLFFHS